MVVTYSEDKKYAMFDGVRYCRDNNTGYYLNSTSRKRLHRAVYEGCYGVIPKGHHIHHRDFDKTNNEPDNLELITASEHESIHWTDEKKIWARDNLNLKARQKAIEWHKSAEGREWHKRNPIKPVEHDFVCLVCGKAFSSVQCTSKFCSNVCKSKYRRQSKADNILRSCACCGKDYETNKYNRSVYCGKSCAAKHRWQLRSNKENKAV